MKGLMHEMGSRALALPTDDEAAVFVAEHADDLAPWFVTPGVEPGLPRRLASKRGLHDACVELGVPVPRALFPGSLQEVEAFADRVTFPVVAKNVDPFSRLRDRSSRQGRYPVGAEPAPRTAP